MKVSVYIRRSFQFLLVSCILTICITIYRYAIGHQPQGDHYVVICIPVYGQSLALGEEAVRITNFDTLTTKSEGRIVTQDMDFRFGYFDNDQLKQTIKKLFRYQKRSFELSVYSMSEVLSTQLGRDTLICIFPGGQGTTTIAGMNKSTAPYQRFLRDIGHACQEAKEKGWAFFVPAICWMQGESDIADYPGTNYRKLLKQFSNDLNRDIKKITGQAVDVRLICYQTNAVSRGDKFKADSFNCEESRVPHGQMELIRDDTLFWASGPTYPFAFAREAIHIDGAGQNRLGRLAARSALGIIRGERHFQGLVPLSTKVLGNNVQILFNVPCPPLRLDTIQVKRVANYGFSVITPNNKDIVTQVHLVDSIVILTCSKSPLGCKVRYAINGEHMKSGYKRGPRGNLRDSQGDCLSANVAGHIYPLHNWCYQFDFLLSAGK